MSLFNIASQGFIYESLELATALLGITEYIRKKMYLNLEILELNLDIPESVSELKKLIVDYLDQEIEIESADDLTDLINEQYLARIGYRLQALVLAYESFSPKTIE